MDAGLSHLFAYYSSAEGFGVLAPRGWHCIGRYGSGGDFLYVSPQAIDARTRLSSDWRLSGPAIELDHYFGDTSGRFNVGQIVARIFPAYRAFALRVMKELPPDKLEFGPYPKDVLTYKSSTIVEYTTPAQAEGIGTLSLEKSDSPIQGVVMLVERAPDVLQLAVRLPPDLVSRAPVIIHEVEREAARRPHPRPDH